MDYKKHLLAICSSLSLIGCATAPGEYTAILPTDEIAQFRSDCKNKESQLAFLQKQYITDRTILPSTGIDYKYHNAIVRRKMRSLEQWC